MPQQVFNGDIEEKILQLLDKVASTGVPVQIARKTKRLVIRRAMKRRELDQLENHPDAITGNPEDLVHVDWTSQWNPDS